MYTNAMQVSRTGRGRENLFLSLLFYLIYLIFLLLSVVLGRLLSPFLLARTRLFVLTKCIVTWADQCVQTS